MKIVQSTVASLVWTAALVGCASSHTGLKPRSSGVRSEHRGERGACAKRKSPTPTHCTPQPTRCCFAPLHQSPVTKEATCVPYRGSSVVSALLQRITTDLWAMGRGRLASTGGSASRYDTQARQLDGRRTMPIFELTSEESNHGGIPLDNEDADPHAGREGCAAPLTVNSDLW
jgi:hypothetical protein